MCIANADFTCLVSRARKRELNVVKSSGHGRGEGKEQQHEEQDGNNTAHAASCQITDDPFLGDVQTKWSMSCIWQPNYDALRTQLCAIKTRIRDYILYMYMCLCVCVRVCI